MLYVANDGGYIIKDRVFINRHDISGCPQFVFPTDCFECDDTIAPAITELLQKGYITKYCCAGHIAPNIDNDAIDINDIEIIDNANVSIPYIMFHESITKNMITPLPEHWKFSQDGFEDGRLVIDAKIDTDRYAKHYDFFGYQRLLIDLCEELYQWACQLKPLK